MNGLQVGSIAGAAEDECLRACETECAIKFHAEGRRHHGADGVTRLFDDVPPQAVVSAEAMQRNMKVTGLERLAAQPVLRVQFPRKASDRGRSGGIGEKRKK